MEKGVLGGESSRNEGRKDRGKLEHPSVGISEQTTEHPRENLTSVHGRQKGSHAGIYHERPSRGESEKNPDEMAAPLSGSLAREEEISGGEGKRGVGDISSATSKGKRGQGGGKASKRREGKNWKKRLTVRWNDSRKDRESY